MTPSWWTTERSLLGLGNPVLREDVRVDGVLVQRTGTQRAPGRFLVDEHRSLAVRARALAHLGRLNDLVRHRCRARGERSHPASAEILPTLNQACPVTAALHGSRFSEGVRVEGRPPSGGGERLSGPDATRPSPRGEGLGSVVGLGGPIRQLRCATCAYRGGRTSERARVASSTATCCSERASSRTPVRRRSSRSCTACSASEAVARKRPGTSPLPRRSHPFAGPVRAGGVGSVCT